jgi:peptide/nickel transport system substrate-binding protein
MQVSRRNFLHAGAATVAFVATRSKAFASQGDAGQIMIGVGIDFPKTMDAARTSGILQTGLGETLLRYNTDMEIVPWLAESYEQVDLTTWRVNLRANAVFWDGTPVTPQDIETSFRRIWEAVPGHTLLLSDKTVFEAEDDKTLVLRLVEPQSDLLHMLASQEFKIHKAAGERDSIMTGPYKPETFVPDEQLVMVANELHWGGKPAFSRIEIRPIVDANARLLGLQSGELDIVNGMPPEMLGTLSGKLSGSSRPSTRIHYLVVNQRSPIFGDHAVRKATSMAIDRQQLLDVALAGQGEALKGMFPSTMGVEIVEGFATNKEEAARILDEAGWTVGSDGVRAKGGVRLAFTIYSYASRAEMTPISVAVSSQLNALGYETNVQEVREIRDAIKGEWDIGIISTNAMGAGPQRTFLNSLLKDAPEAFGGYENEELETTVRSLRTETDPTKAADLFRRAQEIVLNDVANIYLLTPPQTVMWSQEKVRELIVHPASAYFIRPDLILPAA